MKKTRKNTTNLLFTIILMGMIVLFSGLQADMVFAEENAGTAIMYESVEEAGAYLRQQMVKRENTISFQYITKENDYNTLFENIFDEAIKHTGIGTEGDYLKFQYNSWDANAIATDTEAGHEMTITYQLTYYSNTQQEAAVSEEVEKALQSLALEGKSDAEKIAAIYDYVCQHVSYDYDNLLNQDYKLKYTAYAALIEGKAVCQGYANLIYRFMLEAGIDNRIISGVSKTESHAWNIVRIDTSYYNIDATWDAGWNMYSYFLKNDADFIDHTRDDAYSAADFYQKYPMSQESYMYTQIGTDDDWSAHAASSFAGGSGTENAPYLISNASELALLAKYVNNASVQYNKAYYKLTADIDLNTYNWIPIGAIDEMNFDSGSQNVFRGVFDGDGYKIRNLRIEEDIDNVNYYGLFGACMGTVKNTELEDAVINIVSVREGWHAENGMGSSIFVGAIAGTLTNYNMDDVMAVIDNCSAEVDINVKCTMAVQCGGIVGGLNYAEAYNSQAWGSVRAVSARAVFAGGFVGSFGNFNTVSGCSFHGLVTTENDGTIEFDNTEEDLSYANYAGGFAGEAGRGAKSVTLTDCYAKANVYATKKSDYPTYVGVFTGEMGIVYNYACYKNLYAVGIAHKYGKERQDTSTDFAGSMFFDLSKYATTWERTNLVNMNGENIAVYSADSTGNATTFYATDEYDIGDVFQNTLNFNAELWVFEKNSFPILKINQQVSDIHSWNSGEIIGTPTCTTGGTKVYTCLVEGCGATKTETMQPDSGKHTGETEIRNAKTATCSEEGYTGDIYCKKCANMITAGTVISKTAHIFVWKTDKEATATTTGLKHEECTVCNKKRNENTIIEAVGNSSGDKAPNSNPSDNVVPNDNKPSVHIKKGTIFVSGIGKYKVTGTSEVAFIGLKNSSTKKVIIPDKVTFEGKSFKVTSIGNKALAKKKATSVTIGANIKKIGKEAFKGCSRLSKITIKTTKLKSVGRNALKGIKANAKIKVPKKKLAAYKRLLKSKGQGKKVKITK